MSKARKEILTLIAEGKITPEEGERILRGLEDEDETPADEEAPSKNWTEGVATALQDVAETVRRAVDDAIGATSKVFDEHRSETENVEILDGGFEMPPGARLKVQHAIRVSFGGTSKGSHIVLRTGDDERVRIVRGQAVEVHKNGTDYVLTWAKGNLELEVPLGLSSLDVRCMGGDLEVQDYPGTMTLESMGGEIRVRSPRAPFRIRTLGGTARIADLDIREGAATLNSTGGDVRIEASQEASLSIRATTLGGKIEFPPGTERESEGRTRRRALCVIGDGAGSLTVDTLGGDVRVVQTQPDF